MEPVKPTVDSLGSAAEELRRLHTENKQLREQNIAIDKACSGLKAAAGLALEVLDKHRQFKGEFPVGELGRRASESLREAIAAGSSQEWQPEAAPAVDEALRDRLVVISAAMPTQKGDK